MPGQRRDESRLVKVRLCHVMRLIPRVARTVTFFFSNEEMRREEGGEKWEDEFHTFSSFKVPALLPKVSVSMPMFCSMVTKRLLSGLL